MRTRRGVPAAAAAADGWPRGWAIEVAGTRRERRRGLLGCSGLGDAEGLWLPVRSVHTVGMRFGIDLVWLSRDGDVLRVDEHVGRGRVRTCLAAGGGVVEVAVGAGARLASALDGIGRSEAR